MLTRSKKYQQAIKELDRTLLYSPESALEKIKKLAFSNFDESIELHVNLGIDPRHADQQLRGTISLPHGTGKKIVIVVIAPPSDHDTAKQQGADFVGDDDIIQKIQSGWLDFDLVISTPDMMSKVGKLGRILGAKGMMPNPKSGTVTKNLGPTIQAFKSGKIEYRNDKQGLIHIVIGKVSFTLSQLVDNFKAIYDCVVRQKPSKSKGIYLKSIYICATMGPSFNIEPLKTKWVES